MNLSLGLRMTEKEFRLAQRRLLKLIRHRVGPHRVKSIGRRQTRAMLEWNMRWLVEYAPGYKNRRTRRAEAVRVGRLLKAVPSNG